MIVRYSLLVVLACVITALVAPPAVAGPADRNYWKHSKGHFENTSGNNWVEKSGGGTWRYVESDRNDKYVELYDKSREVGVRIYAKKYAWKHPKETQGAWEGKIEGHWMK